jgi:type VI secretion system protein ImpI/type VI secretion system protein
MAMITLSVLRCPDAVVPGQHRAAGGEISIGRGAECDWPLTDPDRVLSKRHCVLEYFSGGWQLRDLSTNGTFVNHATAPVGRDQVRPLLDGDRIRLGAYEIEVRIEEDAVAAPGPATRSGGAGWGAADPFAPAPSGAGFGGAAPSGGGGFGGTPLPGMGIAPAATGGGSLLPDDFDPFADGAPPMPDHAPSTAEAFMPRPVLPAGTSLIPDDWDLDLGSAAPAAATPAAPLPSPPVAPIAAFAPPPPPAAPVAAFAPPPPAAPVPAPLPATPAPRNPFAEAGDPFAEPADVAPLPMPVAATPVPVPVPVQVPVPAPVPVPMPVAAPPPAAGGMPGPGLAALVEGAGLPAAMAARAEADPDAALRAAGALLRAAVAGIRALLIARADVKREFRIEQTMLRAANNNPLKFAATEEQALAALLDPKTPALKAMQETVDDLTAHQVATLAATQAAARALLDRLAPATIEGEDTGGGGLLPGAREKRLWDAYRRRHAQLVEQFEDDFDSAFGKAFARAYEQAAGKPGD